MDIYEVYEKEPLFNQRIFFQLLSNYQRSHRKYHTIQHLEECFEEFFPIKKALKKPKEVALAIWFHDAIYDPSRKDNEEESLKLLKTTFEYTPRNTSTAEKLILSTKNHIPYDNDSAYLIDIDMSILGKEKERVEEYENQLKEEYSVYTPKEYAIGRIVFLSNQLQKLKENKLFHTPYFQEKYNKQSEENIFYLINKVQTEVEN